jgi:hypothetical protein
LDSHRTHLDMLCAFFLIEKSTHPRKNAKKKQLELFLLCCYASLLDAKLPPIKICPAPFLGLTLQPCENGKIASHTFVLGEILSEYGWLWLLLDLNINKYPQFIFISPSWKWWQTILKIKTSWSQWKGSACTQGWWELAFSQTKGKKTSTAPRQPPFCWTIFIFSSFLHVVTWLANLFVLPS